ncbi:MAG: DUF1501 domain-containing protein [Chromatiales bacterium]|nr:DUF1501 domain-containing protein [Chromatiales bacterium]
MKHMHMNSRRQFLKLGAGLAMLGLFGNRVRAAQSNDYKALVCVYLAGGNDGNNMIVPLDGPRHASYQAIRGGLALSGVDLLTPIADANGNEYALHYGLGELNPLYDAGDLAVVLNSGMLHRPLTKAEYLQGIGRPGNLFSHSDQTLQAQTGVPTVDGTGWGGRLLDCFGAADSLAAISVSSPALFMQGYEVAGNVIAPGVALDLPGMNLWPSSAAEARRQAVSSMSTQDGGSLLRQAANQVFSDGMQLAADLRAAGNLPPLQTVFPGTALGNQLREVSKLIRLRAQSGPGRQVFFCSLGGFDTHGGQDWQHWYLLSQLSQALAAFHESMQETGLSGQVTAFTQSEFGRTLQPSGSGSDHAWGNHQLVLGGAVQGGIYGQLPEFALGGPDDANGRGVWIPTLSSSQFGATLGRWFGASEDELDWVFPNLALFPQRDIGFMS